MTVVRVGLLVGVPTLVVVCQMSVQESFARVVADDVAVVLTTLVVGFLVGSSTGGFSVAPEPGRLVGVVALGIAVYGHERGIRDGLRYPTYVPAVAVAGLIVVSGIAEVGSVAGGLFAVTHLAVLGVVAYASDRTDSLFVPALAYGCLSVSNTVVVYLFEAGMRSW